MIDYAFSEEAFVYNQNGDLVSLFQTATVAVRATRTVLGPLRDDYPGIPNMSRDVVKQRAIRIMKAGYMIENPHPRDNPQELDRIEKELTKQLDNNIPTWQEGIE